MKNEPAFPVSSAADHEYCGLTMRDYFAAKAISGLQQVYWEMTDQYENSAALTKCMAESAYDIADAMLAAREAE